MKNPFLKAIFFFHSLIFLPLSFLSSPSFLFSHLSPPSLWKRNKCWNILLWLILSFNLVLKFFSSFFVQISPSISSITFPSFSFFFPSSISFSPSCFFSNILLFHLFALSIPIVSISSNIHSFLSFYFSPSSLFLFLFFSFSFLFFFSVFPL